MVFASDAQSAFNLRLPKSERDAQPACIYIYTPRAPPKAHLTRARAPARYCINRLCAFIALRDIIHKLDARTETSQFMRTDATMLYIYSAANRVRHEYTALALRADTTTPGFYCKIWASRSLRDSASFVVLCGGWCWARKKRCARARAQRRVCHYLVKIVHLNWRAREAKAASFFRRAQYRRRPTSARYISFALSSLEKRRNWHATRTFSYYCVYTIFTLIIFPHN